MWLDSTRVLCVRKQLLNHMCHKKCPNSWIYYYLVIDIVPSSGHCIAKHARLIRPRLEQIQLKPFIFFQIDDRSAVKGIILNAEKILHMHVRMQNVCLPETKNGVTFDVMHESNWTVQG